MKSIGFKNFRKFIEFPEMKFNDITLMVGANNSGKSTLVKAVLLVMDYLKNQQNQIFSFTTENVKDVNIISFDRARCKLQTDDFIYFKCQIASHYEVEIKISGDENSINANVEEVTIADTKRGLLFVFSHTTNSVNISKKNTVIDKLLSITKNIEDDIKRIDSKIKELSEHGVDGIDILREIDNLNKDRKIIIERRKVLGTIDSNDSFDFSYEFSMDRNRSNLNFQDYIDEFLDENENEKRRLINLREKGEFTETLNEKLEEINLVFSSSSELKDSIAEFISAINSHYYYYWSAETQKQSALFSIRDDNNALSKAIHDFCRLRIQRGDDEWLFVENQMRDFEIGERFDLISHAWEAYQCNVVESNGDYQVSLADKGMGSIQLMTLFFRLATIIKQQKKHKENITLIIEEPELNLHPKLQSKLATLLKSVSKDHSIKFIIETHSEYLVRQSQVIVNETKYKDLDDLQNNIFSTFYFKSDGTPYSMQYRTDGKFSNEFGTGFFDEANKLIFEIL